MMQNTTLYIHSFSYNTRVDLWLNRLELAVSLLFAIDVFNSKQSLKWYWIGPKLSRSCVCMCVCVGVCVVVVVVVVGGEDVQASCLPTALPSAGCARRR